MNTLSEEEVHKRLDGKKLPQLKKYLKQDNNNLRESPNIIADHIFSSPSNELCTKDVNEYNKII